MRHVLVVVAALAIACGGKKAEDSSASGSSAAPPKVEEKKPVPKIACEKAIPKEVIAKHVPNAKTEWGDPFDNGDGSFITSCRFVDEAVKGRTIVRYKCGPTFADLAAYKAAVEPQIKSDKGGAFKFGSLDGIGRGGIRDKTSVAVLHRELPCLV